MGCNSSTMGNDVAKMAGLGPPTNKTGSSVVRKKVERASKTGVLSLTEHKLEAVPKIVVEQLGGIHRDCGLWICPGTNLTNYRSSGPFPS